MILVLDDSRCQTAGKTLTALLSHSFNSIAPVIAANAEAFINAIEKDNPSVIVIPEIKGEINYYPEYLGEKGKTSIQKCVAEGSMYVGFCAGAYNACSKNTYVPEGRVHKFRESHQLLALTPIQAKGPIRGYGKTMNAMTHQERGHSCELVPIIIKDGDTVISQSVWYENGPLFHIDKNDVPKGTDVIARYNLGDSYPAAVLVTDYKQGKILLSGVLPHLHFFDNKKIQHPLFRIIIEKINNHLVDFHYQNRVLKPS